MPYPRVARLAQVLFLFVCVIGCASSAQAATTYAQVQAIFDAKCVNCHQGAQSPNLTSAVSYNTIVTSRVTPFNTATSSLFAKVNTGGSMNFAVDAGQLATITAWINEGASTTYTVTPASTSPVAGSDVTISAQLKSMTGANISQAGVTVNWTRSGGGSLSAATSQTNASGVASITLTTTTVAGTIQVVTATTSAATGNSANIVPVAGAASKYTVTSAIPNPAAGSSVMITAQLTDANGNAVATAGKTVTWGSTNGGNFTTPTSQTDATGKATITFTVSSTVGTVHTVTATDNSAFTGTSAAITASPSVTSGAVELISAKQDGGFADDSSFVFSSRTAISADGRFVAFASNATNLVPQTDTNGGADIFVRDLLLKTTTLVTANASGTATGSSPSQFTFAISADGRYVAFMSAATDIVSPAPSAALHAYRRDLMTGQTVLCSVNNNGVGVNQNNDDYIAISGDGRFVAFSTYATNMGVTDNNGALDVYVRDCQLNQTILASYNSAGTATANSTSQNPILSQDGTFVVFTSFATDIAAGDSTNSTDIYRRDLVNNSTILVSAINGTSNTGNGSSNTATMTPDGRYVCFQSSSSNLVAGDTNGSVIDIFRRDCNTNTTLAVTAINGSTVTGTGGGATSPAAISSDGRYVAFSSDATNMVTGDTNGNDDVFVRDCDTNSTVCASAIDGGTTPGNNGGIAYEVSISADGRYVGFSSSQDNLVSVSVGAGYQAYRRDTVTNTTALLSISPGGASGTADSSYVSLSADGYQAAFASNSNNLVTGDTANSDIFGVFFNQVPSLNLGSNASVVQGTAFSQNGLITDANTADTFVATVDYGDGGGVESLPLTGKTFTLSHTYSALGVYTVSVTAMDNHSAGTTASITVSVTPGAGALDTDGDGLPDSSDPDDDNDGVSDVDEIAAGTDPLNPNSKPGGSADFDGDGTPDDQDTDDDNDGVSDVQEMATGTNPHDPNSKPGGSADADSDGIPDDQDPDDDNDGFSDVIEAMMGTSPTDANSTPTGAASPPQALTLSKLAIKLNFAKTASDSIQLSGTLAVPAGFVTLSAPVTVDVGGIVKVFALDAKGRTPKGNDSFKLTVKATKGVVAAQTSKFQAKFNKGDFAAALQDENLTGAAAVKGVSRTVDVLILFNSAAYKKSQPQLYTAAPGKSGKTKDVKP